ncbi:MAG: DUF3467 domain-containing protein [Chloroflexi bacterium]|nr:DUF3467 domain-containing protein [Chloroflexota bacterium]
MSEKPQQKQKQIKIELPNDLTPCYVNFAIINHNYNEIVIDFAHVMPNVPKTRVQNRLVLTPYHAKLLLNALGSNLANYEKRFGEIKTQGTGLPDKPPMGFDSGHVH